MYALAVENKVKKWKKRLPQNIQEVINIEADKIAHNPYAGERKKGDLKEVFVWKFKIFTLQYLIAYKIIEHEKTIIILAIGPHENFYRDLRRFLFG
ncbi:MAG: type II toxin-antitoxin system RelE/ParE family toxin [bacterium]|nr:type II toxin-antitoxin system RelE/ParE family toxin [bacterium]